MSVAIVTGSSGLTGSETARFFHQQDLEIVGIDNNMRQYFFGPDGSTEWNTHRRWPLFGAQFFIVARKPGGIQSRLFAAI